jgi:hypothetical protein
MPNLDDEGSYPNDAAIRMRPVQNDPRINPDGMYSGMTKRSAILDDEHVTIGNMPPAKLKDRGRIETPGNLNNEEFGGPHGVRNRVGQTRYRDKD